MHVDRSDHCPESPMRTRFQTASCARPSAFG
jgi:hypothetical protein